MTAIERATRLSRDLTALTRVSGPGTALRFAWAIARSAPQILQARTLRPADQLMRDRTWSFAVDGADVRVRGIYFAGARELYARRVYFPNSEFRIRAGDQVIDLGANAGLFSVAAAKQGATVLAVEAQAGFKGEIEENARINECADRITVATALVGGGVGVFSVPGDVLRGSHGSESPRVMNMPALLAENGIREVDFLKCDIEGGEFALITDDADWLDRVRTIAMEVHPEFGDPQTLKRRLMRRGFDVLMTDSELRPTESPSVRGGYIYALRR